jgi:hypothetical protein
MSEFRIFCIGAMALLAFIAFVGKRVGDAAVNGSAASLLLPLTIMALGGAFAVALLGRGRA